MGTRAAPIGRTWTRVLRLVHEASLITTDGVAVKLYGVPEGEIVPSARTQLVVRLLLCAMAARRFIRLARPQRVGELWAVGSAGFRVLEQMAKPRVRRYRTVAHHRRKAKARRAQLRALRLCINGASHGEATRGCRCEHCYIVHKLSDQ